MIQRTRRKLFTLLVAIGGIASMGLCATPDPDIFDGRAAAESMESTSASQAEEQAAGGADALPDAGVVRQEPADDPESGDTLDGEGEPPTNETAEETADAQETAGAEEADGAGGGQDAESPSEGAEVADGQSARSFEGLDGIGGTPVAHPGAESVDEAELEAAAEQVRSAGAGTPEESGSGGGESPGEGAGEERSFDDLRVGGSSAQDRQVEVLRSRETRTSSEPTVRTGGQRGTASSPQDEQAGADQGTDVPEGL